jgi:DNA polymerase-1
MIGLDLETTALTPKEGRVRLVQAHDGERTIVADAFTCDVTPLFARVEECGGVAHNANFEELWAREYGFDLMLEDTMIMSRVLYGGTDGFKRLRHGLAEVAERELEVTLDKEMQTSDWSGPLTDEQIAYAELDAEILLKLHTHLKRRLHQEGLWKVYELENRVRPAVDAMERRGVAIHRDRLESLIADATQRAEALKSELAEEWGINPGSSKQLIEHFALEGRRGWPKTEGGKPKTDQEAMKRLLDEEPSVAKWVEWKEIEKIRSTYGKSILSKLDEDGRIRARFNAFGTATGRFSSSNPNLQNIPKRGERGERMRGLFWSGADDRVLIKADYASIELWLAAVRWSDPYMQDALQQGINMHVATAAALFNVKPENVNKEQKATGKIVNFALLYGGSANRILEEFTKNKMPIDEAGAEGVHRKFFDTYKGFARRKEAGRNEYNDYKYRDGDLPEARTVIGRRRNFADWHGPLLNHEIQGTGADGIKFALARMHEDPYPGAYPVLTVHDEIVVEAPAAQQDDVAAWIEECMVQGMLDALECGPEDVPSLPEVEIETGREWS